ncbi:ABC transporter permease [Thermoanaerobacter indiensis]|uniref:ABC transporter permease n=1 Tax=Thermoanaerobacter indiensis TaxID=1125974 RepID=UPI0003784328|nr:FtsX-like permease family protein [Thermoanaerobacter indiensis]
MVIKRIPKRIMLREKAQFLSIVLLVAIASMAYALFSITVRNIDENYKAFIENQNQEDGNFITSLPVDIKYLESKYNLKVEERLMVDYSEDNKTIRVFSISKQINKPFVSLGNMPHKGEILIDPNFFKKHQYKIGDTIKIANKNFIISGIFYLPDYIYIIKNDQDFLPDSEHFGIAAMNEEDLKTIAKVFPYHYYMFKGNLKDIDSFKSDVNQKWGLLKFVSRSENPRITFAEIKIDSVKRSTLPISLFVIFMSSVILFIVMRRLINNMHAEIGTLYSLGYSDKEVIKVFMHLPIYIWLIGSIFGSVLGFIEAIPFSTFFRAYFALPVVKNVYPISELFIAMFLPGVFILSSGYVAIKRFFKLTIVEMLHGVDEIKFNKLPRLSFLDKFSFQNRIMFKYGVRHFAREAVLVVGVFFSTILLMYGLSAKNAVIDAINKVYEKNFEYKYMYILNSISTHTELNFKKYKVEPFNFQAFETKNGNFNIVIYGIEKNSNMVKLFDERGARIEVNSGFVITRPLAQKLNAKEGQEIELKNKFDGKKYKLKVGKIADIPVGNQGFMDINEFNKIFGFEKGSFIGLYSDTPVQIPKQMLFDAQDKNYMIETLKGSAVTLQKSIEVLGLISAILALLIIYVLSGLAITENKKNIGILKMLGFKEKQIFKMILGFNSYSFAIGFLLGIPLSKFTMNQLMSSATKNTDISLTLDLSWQSVVGCFVVLAATYILSRYLVRRKVAKVMPVDILKEQID